jgi:hypothetical protein
MSKLIVTADKHDVDSEDYSFFILDLETNTITAKAPYTEMLDADIPSEAGRKSFRPFGIAQSEDHIFIASNSNIVRFNNKTLEPVDLVSDTGVINTHQISYYEGYLYRTNTSNDTITRIDLATLEEIHFSFKTMSIINQIDKPSNYSEYDNSHLNSLFVYENHIYVIAHNNNIKDSALFKLGLDFETIEHIANLDWSNHEIVVHDGFLYSLGTGSGKLIKLNLNSLHQDKYLLVPQLFAPDNIEEQANHVPPQDGMFLRGMELIDNKLEIFASPVGHYRLLEPDKSVTKITFDIGDCSITKSDIANLKIVTCVQRYIEQF